MLDQAAESVKASPEARKGQLGLLGREEEKGHEEEGGQRPVEGYSRQPPAQCGFTLRQVCLVDHHRDRICQIKVFGNSQIVFIVTGEKKSSILIWNKRCRGPAFSIDNVTDIDNTYRHIHNRDRMIVSTILSSVTGFHRRHSHDGRHVDLKVSRRIFPPRLHVFRLPRLENAISKKKTNDIIYE